MVEELEKAQKALRDMDYDSMSEDGDEEEVINSSNNSSMRKTRTSFALPSNDVDASHPAAHLPSPEVSSESASTLERFLSSADDEGIQTNGNETNKDPRVLIDTSYVPTQTTTGLSGHQSTTSATSSLIGRSNNPSLGLESPSKLMTKIPAPNSLFDDDDSTAAFSVELQTFKIGGDDDVANANGQEDRTYPSANADMNAFENVRTRATAYQPGTAGYLEMEEEPPREVHYERTNNQGNNAADHTTNSNTVVAGESIKTDSGLVLTHRKVTAALNSTHRNQQHQHQHQHQHHKMPDDNSPPQARTFRDTQQDYFEAENGIFRGWNKDNPNFRNRREGVNYFGRGSVFGDGFGSGGNGKNSMVMVQARRLMSYVKIWVVLFSLVALSMTGVFLHSLGHQDDPRTLVTKNDASSSSSSSFDITVEKHTTFLVPDPAVEKILLLPLSDIQQSSLSSVRQQQQEQPQLQQYHPRRLQMLRDRNQQHSAAADASSHRHFSHLRQEFEDWVRHHSKTYHSQEEKEHRFHIWSQNHHRTAEKNKRHGPCTLTKQHVFGSNHLKDLTPEEFQVKFLTGYKGAYTDVLEEKLQALSPNERKLRKASGIGVVLDPEIHKVEYHESVMQKQRHLNQDKSSFRPKVMGASSFYCKWYDVSCILRYIWLSTGIQFGMIGTMEPRYDADAFPNSVDWRDSGAVTDVRTQGECGACWAVTAVETVESAYFIATGTLYTLSESEIIVCDESCEMCSGGWPQNAFEWVMDHGGLPLQSTLPYDAYTLVALTAGSEGESDYYDQKTLESFREQVCPASDGNSNSHSGSNDQDSYWGNGMENENYADFSSQGRYGNIRGYGYATDRCLCYTDGSGCECDDQDEDTAVGNIATYGPAVVCLEASTWQDYTGGIMTAEIGCGQEFLDMNHCVQVVGYAFTDGSNCDDAEEGCGGSNDKSGSGSGSGSNSRSRDSGDREGYWIVRNQWGSSWGMNGYAYVAMGDNTCGILNDMTVAYA